MTGRLVLLTLALSGQALAAERFAVVVGANQGAPKRNRLWYAESDASRFARTLGELGDFPADHVTVLTGASAGALRDALKKMESSVQQAKAAGQTTLAVFYFSGHAGAGALELGTEQLAFGELKETMEASAASVKVVIVDACESGGLTQVKGARPAQVDFVVPTDDSARGVAYIASTAAGEVAQESAAIGASFFTYHLDAALRGAGDANGDGLVSLTEAFQYTASRTITGTASTDVGPQHPTYNFRMAGRGDVILADLRRARARLKLPGPDTTSWVVSQEGRLIAEAPGGLTLALQAGQYRVERRQGQTVAGAEVRLVEGEVATVGALTERAVPGRAKGGGPAPEYLLQVAGGIEAPVLQGFTVAPSVRVSLRRAVGRFGVRLGLGYADGTGQLSSGVLATSRLQSGLAELALVWRPVESALFIDVGLEVGGALHSQWLQDPATQVTRRALAWSVSGGGTAAVGTWLGPVVILAQGTVGPRLVPVDGAVSVRFFAQALLGLGLEF